MLQDNRSISFSEGTKIYAGSSIPNSAPCLIAPPLLLPTCIIIKMASVVRGLVGILLLVAFGTGMLNSASSLNNRFCNLFDDQQTKNDHHIVESTGKRPAAFKSSSSSHRETPQVVFLFFAGIEGTGHHLMRTLYKEFSSTNRFLDKHNLTSQVVALHEALYLGGAEEFGLFSAPVASLRQNHAVYANGTKIFDDFVNHLKRTQRSVTQALHAEALTTHHHDSITKPFPVPLNTMEKATRGPGGVEQYFTGFNSYPSMSGLTRGLQYPDLYLMYRACKVAQVSCGHVYLHRDPASVLHSTTTKRNFWPAPAQIQVLSTMLQVLRSQLADFQENLVACFDFDNVYYDASSSTDDEDGGYAREGLHLQDNVQRILKLLGISQSDFISTFRAPPTNFTSITSDLQVFMDTMIEMSNATMQVCRKLESDRVGWAFP